MSEYRHKDIHTAYASAIFWQNPPKIYQKYKLTFRTKSTIWHWDTRNTEIRRKLRYKEYWDTRNGIFRKWKTETLPLWKDTIYWTIGYWIHIALHWFQMSFQSSFYNGMNRGGIVAAALGDLQVLQGLPQGLLQGLQGLSLRSNSIEEGWEDGSWGLPEENPEVEWYRICTQLISFADPIISSISVLYQSYISPLSVIYKSYISHISPSREEPGGCAISTERPRTGRESQEADNKGIRSQIGL